MSGRHPSPEAASRVSRLRGAIAERFGSATAIYGLIVFTSFVTIAADSVPEAGEILAEAIPALIIFYAAHVFAHTLTGHGEHGLRRSLRLALRHSSGMLYAATPSVLILIVGAVTRMSGEAAYSLSLWAAVIVLGVLGYGAYRRRGASVLTRILGGAGTAMLGILLILLEYSLH